MINASDILNSRRKREQIKQLEQVEYAERIKKQKMEEEAKKIEHVQTMIKTYPIKTALDHHMKDLFVSGENYWFGVYIADDTCSYEDKGYNSAIWWGTKDGCQEYIDTYLKKRDTDDAKFVARYRTRLYDARDLDVSIDVEKVIKPE